MDRRAVAGLALALGVAGPLACSSGDDGAPKGAGGSAGDAAVGVDAGPCWAGAALCKGSCTDLGSDPKHCGACGKVCATGQVCSQGKCAAGCGPGTTDCAAACVDLKSDPQHCGSCDQVCTAAELCAAGQCAASCPSGQSSCAGGCVDVQTNAKHCGHCGASCVLGACIGGKCHCENAVKDATETDIDCGGGCLGCSAGKGCQVPSDCKSGLTCVAGLCGVEDPDLIGNWRFEGNGNDSSGKGHHGALNGASLVPGKLGQGLEIGAGKCLSVPDTVLLDMVGQSALSVSAWVTTKGDCSPADRGIILNKENAYEFGIQCSGNLLQEAIAVSGTPWEWYGTGSVGPGAWHHIAVTYDGATVRHYVDGAEVFTRALSGSLEDQPTGLGIGCRSVTADGSIAGAGSWFVGVIDEVALYRRTLAAAEISAYVKSTQ